jgi:putative polyhydroxyalkanoic acid system protein
LTAQGGVFLAAPPIRLRNHETQTMPKITVRVPTSDPKTALAKVRPALEKTVSDFQGHDLELTGDDSNLSFKFKSMAFTISGRVIAEPTDVLVEVDLPFAALMFKDKAERAIQKNISRALEGPGSG